MNLQRAIEILDNLYMRGYKLTTREHYAAIKLGIEALKAVQHDRQFDDGACRVLLPGETI